MNKAFKNGDKLFKKDNLPRYTEDYPEEIILVRRKTVTFDCLTSLPCKVWDITPEYNLCGIYKYDMEEDNINEYYVSIRRIK